MAALLALMKVSCCTRTLVGLKEGAAAYHINSNSYRSSTAGHVPSAGEFQWHDAMTFAVVVWKHAAAA